MEKSVLAVRTQGKFPPYCNVLELNLSLELI